ncbi:glutamate carboxypeptidase 2-like [Hydractinia symbiolongicarpus]|uniref:glutamate carboxypeptidase 2-like n=1 Tax=Hydractinia symbiolongicarpus TaxID=13093 RepID=UPI00254ABBE5|nr:glutamate carboxypeptidase 2-like [Hydractinia symbiolongicarpus]
MMLEEDISFDGTKRAKSPSRKTWIIIGLLFVVTFIIAFLIGYYARKVPSSNCLAEKTSFAQTEEEKKEFFKSTVNILAANEIRKNLRYFAGKPHSSSTKRNNELIKTIHQRFDSYGFQAEYLKYDTLLSFPDLKNRNYVYIIDESNQEVFRSKGIEDFLVPSENDTTSLPPFNAYGPNGTVEGELLYVNYGRYEDFEELSKYGVNCSGKIVIVRYGKIFRGDKVKNAQDRGAIGILIYSDPFDYSPVDDDQMFPRGRWLPRDGVQRGSIIKSSYKDIPEGDPLTGGYPAKDWAYHADPASLKGLPRIPAQPISAYDAYHLLKRMGGMKVDSKWTGALNVTYNIGPYKNPKEKVKLVVHNRLEVKTITNVCGTIKGKVEPDRYILVGNHIDAWVAGGVDPSSGTAVMMEMARVLGEKVKEGWKPRRTIKFCGWDGEEYNIIGSCEYVEEFQSQLRDRALAYINLDSAVSGNETYLAGASPLLYEMMYEVMKLVPDPHNSTITVFDNTLSARKDPNHPDKPKFGLLGSGSDYLAFYQFIGVPSIDMGYGQAILNKKMKTQGYPMYHSLHDTVYWMEHFVDKEYKCHLTVGRVAMYYLLYMADLTLVPYDAKYYGEHLKRGAESLTTQLKSKGGDAAGVSTEHLISAANNFSTAVETFQKEFASMNKDDALQLRMINDRLVQVEKGFIYPLGLPGRPSIKHYVMAPSLHNTYGSSTFPAVVDLLYDIKKTQNWNEVKKQLTITAYLVQAVAESLASPV